MTDPSAFDTSIRQEEITALQQELINRLHQRGIQIEANSPIDDLSDLLTALDDFDAAVQRAGGDLFVNSPESSHPQRTDFVVPQLGNDETIQGYIKRIEGATERVNMIRSDMQRESPEE